MNILVTGSGGQLGNDIRSLSGNYPGKFWFTGRAELDITKLDAIRRCVSDNQISCIINCAAYTAVDKAENEPDIAKKLNVDAVKNLSIVSAEFDIPLIHISTDYVFDGEQSKPYKENDKTNPLTIYGRTKLEGENEIIKHASKAMIIRTSWLYSSYGNNFVKTILRIAKGSGDVKIVCDQVGTPTYAKDLALFILNNMLVIRDFSKPEVYHFTNEGVASWYDFAKSIVRLAGMNSKICPIETKDYPTPAKRPFYSVLNKSKAKKEFSIEINYWLDSLKECMGLLNG